MASVWEELKRRNVVKVAVAYAIVGWLLVQIAATFLPIFEAPAWILQVFTFFVILGFPLALILSWAYELTPQGIKRTKRVPLSESIRRISGRKLDFAIIGALVLALGFVVVDSYLLDTPDAAGGALVDPASLEAATSESASTPDRRSIAALPFANESAEAENAEFFANGIHDELLTQLAKIGSLRVISRTSVLEYRDSPKNMREIGQELGVATLLEGRVQRAGDMVRINVQLIDAETDEHIWAEVYNRELTGENIFAIQSEMATSIAVALEAAITPEEAALVDQVPTLSARAYDFYLSGNDYFTRPGDRTAMPLALQQYESAVEEDPSFALAWAALSRSHSLFFWYDLDRSPERLALALSAAEEALELAPDLPEAHIALASYYYQGFSDYEKALEELAIAEAAVPNSAEIFELRAYIYRRLPDLERSLASFDRAIELSPRSVDLLQQRAGTHLLARSYANAERDIERIREIQPDSGAARLWGAFIPLARDGNPDGIADEPSAFSLGVRHWLVWKSYLYARNYAAIRTYLDEVDDDFMSGGRAIYMPTALARGIANSLDGDLESAEIDLMTAVEQTQVALNDSPEDPRLHSALGQALAFLGETEAAIEAANRAMELLPVSEDAIDGAQLHLDATKIYAAVGDTTSTLQHLATYMSLPGRWSIESLSADPRFDAIRDDPGFQALVERYRQQ